MQIKLKRTFFEVIGITAVVSLAIGCAFVADALVVRFTTVTPAVSKLIFAVVLPVVLLLAQRLLHRLLQAPAVEDGVNLLSTAPMQFDQLTERALTDLRSKLDTYLSTTFQVQHCALAILDWQRKHYITLDSKQLQLLPQSHALVHFAQRFKTVFCTERRCPQADQLSDAMHAEMLVFMKRREYVFAIPLYTAQDVYGFVFLTLADVKDSKLFATNNFAPLELIGRQYGALLHQVLIYQAVVGNIK
jgi:hypothetical protein